jgi:hypothetical protein
MDGLGQLTSTVCKGQIVQEEEDEEEKEEKE